MMDFHYNEMMITIMSVTIIMCVVSLLRQSVINNPYYFGFCFSCHAACASTVYDIRSMYM